MAKAKFSKSNKDLDCRSLLGRCWLAIHCLIATVFSAKTNVKDPECSMEFIVFYIFKCHNGQEIRLKHYAGMVVIEF